MGVTDTGKFAVLTNYRESGPFEGIRSRGAMVTECLTGPEEETTEEFVERLLASDVKGVGGFSLVCGNLRKSKDKIGVESLAIVSNRSSSLEKVSWIAGERGDICGLSNARYGDAEWPKVRIGKELLSQAVEEHRTKGSKEEELLEKLWKLMDHDTLPGRGDQSWEEFIFALKESVFIPAVGGKLQTADGSKLKADEIAAGAVPENVLAVNGNGPCRKPSPVSEAVGMAEEVYGTQRQTIMLVDWNGKCSYIERSLWDEHGNPIPRGEGDMKFEFQIKGWSTEDDAM